MGQPTNVIWTTVCTFCTVLTSIVMAVSMLTDYWEHTSYSLTAVLSIANRQALVIKDFYNDSRVLVIQPANTSERHQQNASDVLLAIHGGLWYICYDLSDMEYEELRSLYQDFLWKSLCLNHREETQRYAEKTQNTKDARQLRLLNLSISSSLVCLILLITCLVVLWLGLAEKKVPPILIVSVLYLLAALFALFALCIMKLKRHSATDNDFLQQFSSTVWSETREFRVSWSFYLGWVGVLSCLASSASVYVVTRLMRNGLPFLT